MRPYAEKFNGTIQTLLQPLGEMGGVYSTTWGKKVLVVAITQNRGFVRCEYPNKICIQKSPGFMQENK
jgi:hypothetical protein